MEKEKAEMDQIADPRGKGNPPKNIPEPES
jgi:hypothetical protein